LAKNFLKSSIIYTILGFLPLSFAIIFTPIYLQYLNETEFGILNLFTLYSGFIAQTYSLGVSSAFGYIYWDTYKEKNELKKLISSTLGLLLIFQITFISLGLIFGESILNLLVKSSDIFTFNPYLIICLFFSAFMVYYEMFLYFFRNEGKLKNYAILSLSTLILLTAGTIIGVIWLDLKAVGAILGRSFGYGIVIIGFLIYMISKYGISFNFKNSKTLLIFGLPLFINAIIGSLSYGIDRLLIERFDSIETLGIYAFALVIITVVETLFSALNNALSPTLYKYINEMAKEKIKEIQALSHSITLVIMLAIVSLLAILHPVMDFIIESKYHVSSKFVPILAMGFIWRVFSTITSYPLYMNKKTSYILLSQSINLILSIILGYFGFQIWGIMGIVFSIYLVKIIEFLIVRKMSSKVKEVNLNLKKLIILTLFISLIAFTISIKPSLFYNKYIAYCMPLITLITLSPILLKKELNHLLYSFRNRNFLF
jgi:O-antigen/teichoic acid export membrane protein